MLKTKKQIIEDLKLIDVIIEILDARIPLASQNPDIKQITANKKKIVVLNKSDLADEKETKKWIEYFKNQGIIAIPTDSNLGKGTKETLKAVQNLMQEEMEKVASKGRINKNIRIMICGIPNVGTTNVTFTFTPHNFLNKAYSGLILFKLPGFTAPSTAVPIVFSTNGKN